MIRLRGRESRGKRPRESARGGGREREAEQGREERRGRGDIQVTAGSSAARQCAAGGGSNRFYCIPRSREWRGSATASRGTMDGRPLLIIAFPTILHPDSTPWTLTNDNRQRRAFPTTLRTHSRCIRSYCTKLEETRLCRNRVSRTVSHNPVRHFLHTEYAGESSCLIKRCISLAFFAGWRPEIVPGGPIFSITRRNWLCHAAR